jgi:hypothetical protein
VEAAVSGTSRPTSRKAVKGFQNRYVAFVDILGFRSIIERMREEPRPFRTIRDTLKIVARQATTLNKYRSEFNKQRRARLSKGGVSFVGDMHLEMTVFSDSFVISDTSPAWHVLAAVQAVASRFLEEGILTRGGVVRGAAYHRGQVLFGPAINEAYQLETEVARYPRIVVAPDVVQAAWGYHSGLCREKLFVEDADGCWFINVLSPKLSDWDPLSDESTERDERSYRRRIRCMLIDLMDRSTGKPAHRSKVAWLIHQFNAQATNAKIGVVDFA